jgi:hypothetical protein
MMNMPDNALELGQLSLQRMKYGKNIAGHQRVNARFYIPPALSSLFAYGYLIYNASPSK